VKRDMDLVRDILLRIEENDFEGPDWRINSQFEGYSESEVMYHIGLLYKAGYIEAADGSAASGEFYEPTGMTWEGHDFLDAARNQTVWNSAKAAAAQYGGPIPLEVMKALLIKGASTFLGLG